MHGTSGRHVRSHQPRRSSCCRRHKVPPSGTSVRPCVLWFNWQCRLRTYSIPIESNHGVRDRASLSYDKSIAAVHQAIGCRAAHGYWKGRGARSAPLKPGSLLCAGGGEGLDRRVVVGCVQLRNAGSDIVIGGGGDFHRHLTRCMEPLCLESRPSSRGWWCRRC